MGWNNSVFQLLIVSAGSPFSGLFVYSPAPGTGNLIAQITGVAGTDPYGNAVAPVANFGHWNASGSLLRHFGIDANGNTYLANSSGLTVTFGNSSDGSTQYYSSAGAGAGNLVASIAPASGTDPSGNLYVAGISAYGSGVAANLNNIDLSFFNLTGGPQNAPHVTSNNAASTGTTLDLSSGAGAFSATQAVASLYDSLQSPNGVSQIILARRAGGIGTSPPPQTAAFVEIEGTQALTGIATPGSPTAGNTLLFSDTNGFERMLPGLAGDTNAYQIGEIVLTNGGFTINSTTPQTIMSCPVGIGTYVTEVWLVVANSTAADAAGFAFSGPAAGVQLVDFESKTTGTATVGYGASATYTTQFSNQGVAGNQGVLFRMLAAFSASGTLAITGKQLVALNNVTVFGGWMRVRHVS